MGEGTSMAETATVVIPTSDRPDGLRRLLAALAVQQDPGVTWDVLVVDNGAAGDVDSTELAPLLPVHLRLVREGRRSASFARNRGIAEAAGELIAFIDDDVVPAPTWLREVLAPLRACRFDGVGGRVRLDPALAVPVWLYEGARGYLADYDRGHDERELDEGDWIITANAAFTADVLRRSGGFDGRLGPRPGVHMVNDDVLLFRRVQACGGRIGYAPRAVVVHDLPPTRLRLRWMLSRLYDQGRSDVLLEHIDRGQTPRQGLAHAARTLAHETRSCAAQGLWHRPVAFRYAGEVVRAAGSCREAAALALGGTVARG